jgi:uncharacterized protein (TIGR03437 family)
LNLVLFILIAVALTAGSAFGQLTSIRITAPTGVGVTCPASAPGGSGAGSLCVNLTHGQTVQLSIAYTGTAPFDPTIAWSFGSGGSNTIGTISNSGLYTAPSSIFQQDTIVIKAASTVSGVAPATATIFLIPTVGITITPTTASLTDGQSVTFQAPVTGTQDVRATFSIPQGTPGTIQDTGVQNGVATAQYTAPVPITSRLTFSVTAVSAVAPNQTATATVTITPAAQAGVTVNPPQVTIRNGGDTQQFNAAVVGLSATTVNWTLSCGQPAGSSPCGALGTILSTGLYIAPQNITQNQIVIVTATSTVNGAFFGTATVTLVPPALVVAPASVTLGTNQTQQFTATINSNPYTNVTWSLSSGFGTISANGLYTAPSFAPAKLVIQVIATDNVDPTHTGTATVTINQSVATIAPASVSLTNGGTQQFTFNIDGVPVPDPTAVMWAISPNTGTISTSGLYTAPPSVTTGSTVTLTGTLLQDPSKTAKATISLTVLTDVGHGAPTLAIQELFVTNWSRGGFNNMVSVPPLGDVKRLGTTGYVQEFSDANKTSGVKWALVLPTVPTPTNPAPPVYQLNGDVYGYYSSVGVTTAGYPTMDTQNCPYFDPNNSCTYDIFDKGVALFVYKLPIFAAQTQFTISGVFYTKWSALGGMASGPGRPIDASVAITSSTKVTANVQTFAGGAIYQITSGANNAQVFAVLTPIYTLYQSQGGPTGYLGLPTGAEIVLSTGDHRQAFEGGSLQYTPGSTPVVRLPVASVALSASGTIKMNAGDTTALTASAMTSSGAVLTDRTLTWSTSNGQVVTIAQTTGNGASATIKAVGAGTASVRASADGVVSSALTISVTAPCCQVGDGAPTVVISQAFQAAVTRNHLSVALPAANAVQRMGHGYVQQLQDAAHADVIYLVTKSDNSATAYVVTGAILTRYQQLDGVSGSLGFPTSDASAGGTQTFEAFAALSGSPAILISGGIYTKWAALGSETGAAGPPTAEAVTFTTNGGNSGNAQTFKNGVIYGATAGPRTGQTFFVSGLILAQYTSIGGPAGSFGMPVTDEFQSGVNHRQNFENGYIDYNTGDTVAVSHAATQKPTVVAPQSVLAGSRLHLAITGFQAGASVIVTATGQPNFTVTVANGSYAWDVYVPLTAKAAAVAIHAADTNSGDAADASYNILSLSNNRAQLAKVQGDTQTGLPGALVPQLLQVVLRDASGNPVIGAPLVFQASPGATIVNPSAVTDQNGQGQAGVRLPLTQGLAAVTVDSPGIAAAPVTFYATATSSSLGSYPRLMQSLTTPLGNGTATIAQKGALITAVASMLRYYQNRGDVVAPNGLADPGTLNSFLKSFCVTDAQGKQICDGFLVNSDSAEQVVNLWRVGEFVSGTVDVSIENSDLNSIRDLVAAGSPVLVSLALSADGNAAGGHYVVAIGVGPNGEILIHDPSPAFAQPQLDMYLGGFTAGAHAWTGQVLDAVRLVPRIPPVTRFLLATISQPTSLLQNLTMQVTSNAGACGANSLDLTDAVDSTGATPPAPGRVSRFVYCDGSQPLYQIDVGAAQPVGGAQPNKVTLTDFAKGGAATDLSASAPASYQVSRPSQVLAIAPQTLTVLSTGVVNTANFTPPIAPGGLFTVFGGGFSGASGGTTVAINGETAPVVSSTPFQVNGQVPADLQPGSYSLQLQSPFGQASQNVQVLANAPAIFLLGASTQGAIRNQDNSINSDTNPISRGQAVVIYATGLGTVAPQGNQSVVTTPVSVVLAGDPITPTFAGLSAGLIGVYQVNVTIPVNTPPGLDLPLLLRQGNVDGNTVSLSVQ